MNNNINKQSKKFYCCYLSSNAKKKKRKLSQPNSEIKTKGMISSISKNQYIESRSSLKHINNLSLESDIHLKSFPKENLNSKFDSTAHSNNIPITHKKNKSISTFNKTKLNQTKQNTQPQSNVINRKYKKPATHIINSSACIKQIIIAPTLHRLNASNQLHYMNNSLISISLLNNNVNNKNEEYSVFSSKNDNCSLNSNKSQLKLEESNLNISSLSKDNKSIISNNVISTNQIIPNKCESSSFSKTIPFNESSSSFIPSDLIKNINIPIGSICETEFEISNETSDGLKTVIETPISNKKLFLPKRYQYQRHSNTTNKKLNDKIIKKDNEIKSMKEKITSILNTIHTYEEENKKTIRFIEKAESEAEMLRYMLNFLLRNNKSRND